MARLSTPEIGSRDDPLDRLAEIDLQPLVAGHFEFARVEPELLQDGRVLITGGTDERDDRGVYNSTEFFDAKTNTFTLGPLLRHPRYKHNGTATLLPDGGVVLAGGAAQAETFDPRGNSFSPVDGDARMAGQFSATALLSGGRVLVTGGYGNGTGPRASSWLYRP